MFDFGRKTRAVSSEAALPKRFGANLTDKINQELITPGVSEKEERALMSVKDYVTKVTGKECKLPQHLINDVYSMYVNKNIKRKPGTPGTSIKNKIIDKVYNSFTKVLTEDSPLFTSMLTRELALYMQKVQDKMEEEEEKKKEQQGQGQGGDEGDGQGKPGLFDSKDESGDNDGEEVEGFGKGKAPGKEHAPDEEMGDVDKAMDKILDETTDDLEKSIETATQKMEELKESLGEKAMIELSEKDNKFLDTIDNLKDALKRVSISRDSVKNVLVKILDKSQNYFSAKYTTEEESIFDSDDLSDIEGLEYLHPIFKCSELDNVVNIARKYEGKIDLYLDTSGSMSSSRNFEGQNIRMIDLVKGIAIVLFRLGMLDKLYFFDTQLHEIKNINEFTILGFNKSGGTDFNNVVNQVKSNGRNSVAITDGEDSCQEFTEKIFWIGVGGTKFDSRYGSGNAFETYKKNGQCASYNSNTSLFDKLT